MRKGMGMGTGTSITSTLTMVPVLVVGRGRNIGFSSASSADDCSKQFGRQLLLRLVSFAVEICYVVASRGVQDGERLFNALGLWPFATLLFCLPLGMQLSMKYV